jgi:RimJ/RimL family protein N-acetyltransferase
MQIETERLLLRYPTLDDVDAFFDIHSDTETLKYWFEPAWTDRAQSERRITRQLEALAKEEMAPFVVTLKSSGAVIGGTALHHIVPSCRRAEIGYIIGRSQWGKGYGAEAVRAVLCHGFGEMKLNRIEADIDPNNAASAKLLMKLGFQLEGTLRERWIVDGVVSDTGLYGLLARDFIG